MSSLSRCRTVIGPHKDRKTHTQTHTHTYRPLVVLYIVVLLRECPERVCVDCFYIRIIFSSPVLLCYYPVLFLHLLPVILLPLSIIVIFSSFISSPHLLYYVSYQSLLSVSGHSQSYPPSSHLSSLPASLSLHSSVNRFSLDLSSTKTRQCPVEYTHTADRELQAMAP